MEPDVTRALLEQIVDVSVPVTARALGLSVRHVKRLLRQHAARFDQPRYRRIRSRTTRVLTAEELRTLKKLMEVARRG